MTRRSTDRRPALLAVLSLSLAVLSLSVPALTQTTPDRATEPALTNQDVVKLSAAGLGEEVVIAKINQATRVDFQLDTDALVRLREQGVGKAVITAMLNRAGSGGHPTAPGQAQPAGISASTGGSGTEGGQPPSAVRLRTTSGEIDLIRMAGSIDYRTAGYRTFNEYSGVRATIRISDRQPSLVLYSTANPAGRFFLVRCDVSKKRQARSVRLGAGIMGLRAVNTPNDDFVVPCTVAQERAGAWLMVPKAPLEPGEYGVFVASSDQLSAGELCDFGVD
ncbi:MAG: hypothetical protein AB2L07_10750 [Thermoanaerobaculaceae bacterium]